MKIKANLLNKPVNFQMDDCQIEKVVELPRDQFSELVITPLTNQPFIAENKKWMFVDSVLEAYGQAEQSMGPIQ